MATLNMKRWTTTESFKANVTTALSEFMTSRRTIWMQHAPVAGFDLLHEYVLAGGKRIRAELCRLGWTGVGQDESSGLHHIAAALEMLHAFALIHDDIMDQSDFRRGNPSLHRQLENMHRQNHMVGNSEKFGRDTAILMGDVAGCWVEQLVLSSPIPDERKIRTLSLIGITKDEAITGQFLDLLGEAGHSSPGFAERIARLKTSFYTVCRPLQIGAIAAGALEAEVAAYESFAIPLGDAFQIRDDILGTFGDVAETGKPIAGDFVSGKCTYLVSYVMTSGTEVERKRLKELFGSRESTLDEFRLLLRESGALASAEETIATLLQEALEAVESSSLSEQAKSSFDEIAHRICYRKS